MHREKTKKVIHVGSIVFVLYVNTENFLFINNKNKEQIDNLLSLKQNKYSRKKGYKTEDTTRLTKKLKINKKIQIKDCMKKT